MKRTIALTLALSALVACTSSSSKDADDSAPPDDTAPADDSGVPADGLVALTDPCEGQGTVYGLHFTDANQGWVGCGNGAGLHGTTDGGDSFSSAHPSGNLYVWQIIEDADGRVLVCGHDYESSSDGLLLRQDGGSWTELLRYGNNNNDPGAVYMTDCGQVAALDDGTLIVANSTGPDITWSSDDGLTWAKEDRYWEDANLDGARQAYTMISLTSTSDSYAAGGSTITVPPTFFGPSAHPDGAFYNFRASVIDAGIIGEVWSLATPDDGATWYAGGRDQDATTRASGFIYRSTDGGETWSPGALGSEIDVVHDIDFDGQRGVAVGHRYPPATLGGFVLLTSDGGQTWTEVEADVPILYSADVVGDTYWVGGDFYLGRGRF